MYRRTSTVPACEMQKGGVTTSNGVPHDAGGEHSSEVPFLRVTQSKKGRPPIRTAEKNGQMKSKIRRSHVSSTNRKRSSKGIPSREDRMSPKLSREDLMFLASVTPSKMDFCS